MSNTNPSSGEPGDPSRSGSAEEADSPDAEDQDAEWIEVPGRSPLPPIKQIRTRKHNPPSAP